MNPAPNPGSREPSPSTGSPGGTAVIPVTVAVLALATGPLPPAAAVAAQDVSLTPRALLQVGEEEVTALDFSADGAMLLVGDGRGRIAIHSLEDEELHFELPTEDRAVAFAGFIAGDTGFVSVDREGQVQIHRIQGDGGIPRSTGVLRTTDPPARVALDAGRRYLAVGTRESRIELFDLPTRQRLGVVDVPDDGGDLLHLGFDRTGRQLVAVSSRGGLTAWNPANLDVLRRVTLQGEELQGSRSVVHAVGSDRGANILVVALEEVALPRGGLRGAARPGDLVRQDHLLVFDWHSGAKIKDMEVSEGVIDHLAVGPGNDHAVASVGRRVVLMDLRAGERGAGFSAPARVTQLSISPGYDRLAVGMDDGGVSLWDMEYRAPATVDDLAHDEPGLSGRLRVLGDDAPAIDPDDEVVLAVLPFDDRMGEERMALLVPELLTTQLANLEHLTLVERLRIDDLLEELELRREGITEARGLELGRMLNADVVLLGSIGALGTTITLSARLLRVETGETLSGRQVLCEECRARDIFDAIHLLGTAIAR